MEGCGVTEKAGKVDFKRELACYRAVRDTPALVEVPDLTYLMVDGHGDPNAAPFADATASLYPIAYALKFASKHAGRDFVVMPLEGLWWADDMGAFTQRRNKSAWHWTAMIMVPDWITADAFAAARDRVAAKPDPPSRLADVRLETLSEGLCVQALHLGPYDDEGPLLRAVHDLAAARDLVLTGRHHEVYLGDPRRVAPAKLRTILRQPVTRAEA